MQQISYMHVRCELKRKLEPMRFIIEIMAHFYMGELCYCSFNVNHFAYIMSGWGHFNIGASVVKELMLIHVFVDKSLAPHETCTDTKFYVYY